MVGAARRRLRGGRNASGERTSGWLGRQSTGQREAGVTHLVQDRRMRGQSPRILDGRRRKTAPQGEARPKPTNPRWSAPQDGASGADVMPQVSGRADGSVVSQLVKEKLS